MPMIDLVMKRGCLEANAKIALIERLTTILLKAEGAPDNAYSRALSWCFVHELDEGSIHVGGAPSAKPVYRVTFTVPEGAPGVFGPLMGARREEMYGDVTRAVLEAEGAVEPDGPVPVHEAHRVWVHLTEIPDGHWAGQGRTAHITDITTIVGIPVDGGTDRGREGRAAIDAFLEDL